LSISTVRVDAAFHGMARHAAGVLGVLGVLAVAGLYVAVPRGRAGRRPVALFSEPFDSNLPVQWDDSAASAVGPNFDGLSRYFSAASAHLRGGAPRAHAVLRAPAREQQLALVSVAAPAPAGPHSLRALRGEMRRADSELRRAQAEMHALVEGTRLAVRPRGTQPGAQARQQMLMGIGGWGSGEEMDNAGDWEVAMHVDKGCEETLELRHEGNPGWKRKKQDKCDPNKVQNPMMWPFDKPGEVWLHDSTDSSKEPEKFPYDTDALHDNVWDLDQTPSKADGIWHSEGPVAGPESFRRSFDE